MPIDPFQHAAWTALTSPTVSDVLLEGGARSGKTDLITRWLLVRAAAKPGTTHAVFRFRFNHLKASLIYGTLPEVCAREWPKQKVYELNKSDWYAELPNGSRIYFGGLDDKERTDKILGQGHSTIWANEASQITYGAWLKATTRLSQNKGLVLKAVCDQNPSIAGHWTELLWHKGKDPSTRSDVPDRSRFACVRMDPWNNPHIPPEIKRRLENLPPREKERFWYGRYGQTGSHALWTYESIERARVESTPPLSRITVMVDPSGCSGPEDERSDEVGISVVGTDSAGAAYALADLSGRFGPGGDAGWGSIAVKAYKGWSADHIAAERNFGGAMVGHTIYAVDPNVPFVEITASRGKHVRAEPVGALCDRGKLKFVGHFPELEEQLLRFTTAGYTGDRSPDRADALIHAVHDLGLCPMPGQGLLEWYEQQAAKSNAPAPSASTAAATAGSTVVLIAPRHIVGTVMAQSGCGYVVDSGRVSVRTEDVASLLGLGFLPESAA